VHLEGVIPVPEAIAGTAFFPGGNGLWMEEVEPSFPVGGIMVLGHDFHSVVEYEGSLNRGKEDLKAPTWRNLLKLLEDAEVPREQCFFTNFFMGLRAGTATTGVFPGRKDARFVAECSAFFLTQLRHMKPRGILVLGSEVPSLIAPLAPQLSPWIGACLGDIDRQHAALRRGVQFTPDVPPCTVVSLIHPSLRHANLRHRTKALGRDAHAVEVEMLRSLN
jgi:hypothetical protein